MSVNIAACVWFLLLGRRSTLRPHTWVIRRGVPADETGPAAPGAAGEAPASPGDDPGSRSGAGVPGPASRGGMPGTGPASPGPVNTLARAEWAIAASNAPYLGAHDLASAIGLMTCSWSEQAGIPARFDTRGEVRQTPGDAALLRVAHAALTNVGQHSCAERVTVLIEYTRERARLVITDDGRGFNLTSRPPPGTSLAQLRAQLATLSGWLRVEAVPGRGCSIEAGVPLLSGARQREGNRAGQLNPEPV